MRAFSLLCLCSLLGLTLAQNDINLFVPYGTGNGDTLITSSATVSFAYNMDGTDYSTLAVSFNGAAFPTGLPVKPNKSIPYKSVTYPVIGPMWSSFDGGQVSYRTTNTRSFLDTWQAKANDQFHADQALIVTWKGMTSSSFPGKTVSFQMIILSDSTGAAHSTYVFYQYAEIEWFALNNMRPGFSDGDTSSTGFNYESPLSSTSRIQTTKGKAGQNNFFFKISATPFVDTHLAADASQFRSVSNKFIAISFTPDHDSHGATAFNFYKPPKTGNTPLAYAVQSSSLYCFTAPYKGLPENLATSKHFAKSNVAGLTAVWQFPANHNFKSNKQYYCYVDKACTADIVTVAGTKRTAHQSQEAPAGATADPTNGVYTNIPADFAYQFATILFGSAAGDPVFKSLRTGDNFLFGGEAGKHFNLYHDRYVNLNAEFDYANPANKEGTIIKTVGVTVGGHKISFSTEDFATASLQVNLDGKSVKLYNDKVHLSGCVDIHYLAKWSAFYVVSPTHKLKFTLDERHSEHMNNKFINIAVEDVPEAKEDRESLGGVIGQTIKAGPINTNAADFQVSSLFAVEKSNYVAAEFEDCV